MATTCRPNGVEVFEETAGLVKRALTTDSISGYNHY
jgi:hypothetical protein